jgi:hypothetical protein
MARSSAKLDPVRYCSIRMEPSRRYKKGDTVVFTPDGGAGRMTGVVGDGVCYYTVYSAAPFVLIDGKGGRAEMDGVWREEWRPEYTIPGSAKKFEPADFLTSSEVSFGPWLCATGLIQTRVTTCICCYTIVVSDSNGSSRFYNCVKETDMEPASTGP